MNRIRLGALAFAALSFGLLGVLLLTRHHESQSPIPRSTSNSPASLPIAPLRLEFLDGKDASSQSVPGVPVSEQLREAPLAPASASMPMQIVLNREQVLKQRDGLFAFNTRFYGATIEKGEVEVATGIEIVDLGQPRLSYRLQEVRVGGTVVAQGGEAVPTANLQERSVSYQRGSIEERYVLGTEHLEQMFVINELPRASGDLVIVGSVQTNLDPPADRTHGEKLSFTRHGYEFLSISEAVAVDAKGQRLALELAYVDGKALLTIPSTWVLNATLPIVVDPMVGGPIVVDSSVSNFIDTVNSQFVRICDVAYNSTNNNWLVVWCEQVGASSFDYNVLGQRVSATGTLTGGVISIATSTAGEYECSVCFASTANAFLVAWRHDPSNNSSSTDQRISGRIVNGDGTLNATTLTIEDPAGQDYAPSIAFDGTQWFVTYTSTISSTDHNIRGRFVSTTGTLGTSVTIDSATDLGARSSITFGAGVYMIVWEKGVSTGNLSIVARTMTTTGTFPTGITTVSQASNDARVPDVSYGSNKFLIVWQHKIGTSDRDIYGRVATSTLTFDTAATGLKTGTKDQTTPRAAFGTTSNEWYVVHSDSTTGSTDIYGFKVSLTGVATPSELVSNSSVTDRRPELAYNSATNEMLVAFLSGSATPWQIQAQRISMVTPSLPAAPVITTASKKVKSQNPIVQGTGIANSTVTVYYNTTADGVAAVNGSGNWTYTATTKSAATYTVKARTNNLAGQSGDSNSITITVDLTAPPVPTNIRTSSYTSCVDVEWDPVTASDFLGYNIYRKTGTGGTWGQLNTTGVVIGTKYRDTTVVTGTTYFYHVTAVDNSLAN